MSPSVAPEVSRSRVLPQGAEVVALGIHYRIWAPKAQAVSVEIDFGKNQRVVRLEPSSDNYFAGIDERGRQGDCYRFRLDDSEALPDPASRWQPEGVHGPSVVIDPSAFPWTDAAWRRPPFRDLVIYELHIGTFTPQGTFRSAIEKLEHLRGLGVNAIEIMPIGDFAGGRNWGYDGVYLFAPARAYGHPDDLRALVNAAHRAGLAVILDVVYNHFGPDGNYLHSYIGEFLDESKKTPWGGAIRYGDPEFAGLRQMVVANPAYWMREFHVDGFRCDATHAIFDTSRRHLLKEITASIHTLNGYAIAEDARNDVQLILPEEEGGYGFDAVWADDFHHVVRVTNTHEDEGYFADFTGSVHELVETLQHGWFYRGQRSVAQGECRGTECRMAPPQGFVHCISNHDQTGNHAFGERLAHRIQPKPLLAAEALLCLSPYTPLLFMGQEWAASTAFLFFCEHNAELGELIRKGRREEFKHFKAFQEPELLEKVPDPQKISTFEASKLLWDELTQERHQQKLALYRECLRLRASTAAFRPLDRSHWQALELEIGVGVLCLQDGATAWRVIFDLVGGHKGSLKTLGVSAAGASWDLVLSSNESRFGGSGTTAINLETLEVDFAQPETIVLRSARRQDAM